MSFSVFSDLSFTYNATDWTVEMELFGGSAADNRLDALEATRKIGEKEINPLNPFSPTTLRLKILDKSRIVHDKILANDFEDIRVTVTEGSTTWFQGILDRVSGGDDLQRTDPELRLVFHDGRPFLRDETFEEHGRPTLLQYLWYLLTDSCRVDLATRVAIGWEDANADVSSGRSRALQHDLEWQGKEGSFYQRLSEVLRFYNLQCFQEDGKWRILHRSLRDATSFDYEERDAGGTETTGSRTPSVSISDSDWSARESGEGGEQKIKRKHFFRTGWETSVSLPDHPWTNKDFTDTTVEPVRGNTALDGWYANDTFYSSPDSQIDQGANQVVIDGTNGINASGADQAWIEQVFDRVLINSAISGADQVTFQIKGDLEVTNTNSTASREAAIAELVAINFESGTRKYWDGGWKDTQSYITVSFTEADGSSKTVDFDKQSTVGAPDVTIGNGYWTLRLRLVAEGNVDSDVAREIDVIKFASAELREYTVNADDVPHHRRLTYKTTELSSRETENLQLASGAHEVSVPDNAAGEHTRAPSPVRFLDSRQGDIKPWQQLHFDSSIDHVNRSFSASGSDWIDKMRMLDRLSQTLVKSRTQLGVIDKSKFDFRDTIDYDGKTWVPHFFEERIRSEKRLVGLMELRSDSLTGDLTIESD